MRSALPSVPTDLLRSAWVYLLARIVTGIVFLWAGGVRLMDMGAFIKVLSRYSFLPEASVILIAIIFPVAQLIAGVGLLLDLRGNLKASSCVLLTFLTVFAYGILGNLNAECSFFTIEPMALQDSLPLTSLRDLALLVVMLYLFLWERARRQTWRWR
jgi:hypothetical protein